MEESISNSYKSSPIAAAALLCSYHHQIFQATHPPYFKIVSFCSRSIQNKKFQLIRHCYFSFLMEAGLLQLVNLKQQFSFVTQSAEQRWSPRGRPWPRGRPRGHILKSLASRPQVLENWPVLGSRTALFFELLKFCGALEKFFGKRFFCGDRLKNFCADLFFWRSPEKFLRRPFFLILESTCACVLGPWP